MPAPLLEILARFELDPATAARLRLAPGPVALKRAWPGKGDHLLLEYGDSAGSVLAGQWHRDSAELERLRAATEMVCPTVALVCAGGERLLLQAGGADAKLRELWRLARAQGATLLVHRAERRAVIRRALGTAVEYQKVVRTGKVPALLESLEHARRAAEGAFAVPEVLGADEAAGLVVLGELRGTAVHDIRDLAELRTAHRLTGAAIARLHRATPTGVLAHDAAAEAEVVLLAHSRMAPFFPDLAAGTAPYVRQTVEALRACGSSTPVLIHRDLHDKQVFVGPKGQVGLLDVDLLARGDAELDIGNWLAHIRLRALQGLVPPRLEPALASEFLEGYSGSFERGRVDLYTRATLLRLACLYAFRPGWPGLSERVLALFQRH